MNILLNGLLKGFKRVLVIGLVSLSLWSIATPAQAADANDYYKNERGSIQGTERYDKIQSEKGGMNNFDAVDPRRNTTEADAKAQELLDVAKRRKALADDPLEPAREAIDNLQDKVTGAASNLASDAKEAVKDVSSDVKSAGRQVSKDMRETSSGLIENAKEQTKNGRVPNQMNR